MGGRARGGFVKVTTTHAVFDPDTVEDPLLRQALKEPVAFFGGMFAGMLGLSTGDEPLKSWVEKTSEAAGVRVVRADEGVEEVSEVSSEVDGEDVGAVEAAAGIGKEEERVAK